MIRVSPIVFIIAGSVAATTSVVHGQPADPPLTDEELAEITAATGADASATAETESATTPAAANPLAAVGAMIMNPELSVIMSTAAAYFSDADNLQIGGHDPTRTGFTLQQVELSIGKAVDPYFRFDGNIVFSPHGAEVEEAYATTLALPANLQARAGEMLTRFGRQNPTHLHAWSFVDHPLMLGRVFGGDGNHAPGVELSYLTPLPWFVEVIASATDAHGEETARSFLPDDELAIDSPKDVLAMGAVKQFFELGPDWSLLWGVSGMTGPNPAGRTHLAGTDVSLKWRPISYASEQQITVQSEWLYRRRGQPGGALTDLNGYAFATWRFAKRWDVGARWELGTAADETGGDPLDPEWIGDRQRISAELTFDPTEFSRLRLQGSQDRPSWRDPIWAGFLTLTLSAGSHGAHKY